MEQFSSARHHLGFYNNVGITATYTLSTSSPQPPLKQTIFAALAAVIERHPILSVIPVNEDSASPYFARLPSINLEEAVPFITRLTLPSDRDVELDAILEKEHNTNFKAYYGSLPFWRLVIITLPEDENAFIASFIFHHALGDGASGLVFQKDFYSFLSAPLPPLQTNIIIPPTADLLPNLEQLHPLPLPSPNPTQGHEELWTGAKISLPVTTRFRSLTLSQETTAGLIAACRAHGTTLTSTLPVIIASALSKHIHEQFNEVECTIPVSLRRFLQVPVDKEMGVWIDAFSTYFARQDVLEFNWEEARRSKEDITSYLKAGEVNVGKFKAIPDVRALFSSRLGQERGSTFDVSNLGSARTERGEWKMGRVVFSRSAFASGSSFSTGVITGGDGCAVLGFVWQEGVVREEVMEGVVEGVRRGIEDIVLR
jgi:hypothetical protein